MNKHIDILYLPLDVKTANSIKRELSDSGYDISMSELDETRFLSYISSINPKDCQLIISVNMAGFAGFSSDGGATFNKTPINVISLLTVSPKPYEPYLKRRLNYTISFLVLSDSDKEYMKQTFTHIYNVDTLSALSDLPDYLNNLDWRF